MRFTWSDKYESSRDCTARRVFVVSHMKHDNVDSCQQYLLLYGIPHKRRRSERERWDNTVSTWGNTSSARSFLSYWSTLAPLVSSRADLGKRPVKDVVSDWKVLPRWPPSLHRQPSEHYLPVCDSVLTVCLCCRTSMIVAPSVWLVAPFWTPVYSSTPIRFKLGWNEKMKRAVCVHLSVKIQRERGVRVLCRHGAMPPVLNATIFTFE